MDAEQMEIKVRNSLKLIKIIDKNAEDSMETQLWESKKLYKYLKENDLINEVYSWENVHVSEDSVIFSIRITSKLYKMFCVEELCGRYDWNLII